MIRPVKKRWIFLLLALGLLLGAGWATVSSMRATRPVAPPPGSPIVYSWGSMHLDASHVEPDSDLERTIKASFESEPEGSFDPDNDGRREYSILVLSGGGSSGAFGAGFLTGWSKTGTRPDFKIVTGVSTGSLQSTFAFLGPEYDDELTEVFTLYDTEQIYTKRSVLGAALGESAWDTAPLKELIARYITGDVLAAVAAKHATGHRLFIGTANMDTDEFIIWDMGAIASSDRPDKLDRYRNVLLASSSIPVLFPPVYFEVEIDGQQYHEMHVDGGIQAQLFLRGFMLDCEETIDEDLRQLDTDVSLYLIRNGAAKKSITREITEPSSIAIASATVNQLDELSNKSSLFRVYVLAARHGIDFNLAAIPDEEFPDFDSIKFDTTQMRELYDFAYQQASSGYEWAKVPPGLDPTEAMQPLPGRNPEDAKAR
ncbi:MAG: patatin family protein [Rhodothermales bacterium]|nr:patatin family protein [Rhodothermales bacterium]